MQPDGKHLPEGEGRTDVVAGIGIGSLTQGRFDCVWIETANGDDQGVVKLLLSYAFI